MNAPTTNPIPTSTAPPAEARSSEAAKNGSAAPVGENGAAVKPVARPDPKTQPDLESWTVPLASIDAEGSPFRFRRRLHPDGAIKALAASIDAEGLLHPLVVRKVGSAFQLVGGFRRHAALSYLASTRGADPASMPVKVSVLPDGTTDDEALSVSFAENLARKSLGAEDKAIAAVKLRDTFGKTQEEIASILKVTPRQLARFTSVLTAPKDVREAFGEGRFGLRQAVAIAGVADPQERKLWIERSAVKQLRSTTIGRRAALGASALTASKTEEVPESIRSFVRVSSTRDASRPIQVVVKLASEDAKKRLLSYLARMAA